MAHPKSKISKQRKRKRRTHKKAVAPQYSICSQTGQAHLRHHAYEDESGNVYYKGKILIPAETEETLDDND